MRESNSTQAQARPLERRDNGKLSLKEITKMGTRPNTMTVILDKIRDNLMSTFRDNLKVTKSSHRYSHMNVIPRKAFSRAGRV